MTLTGKQRAFLRAMANGLQPIVHVGKGGVIATLEKQADDALEARELIKGKVLESAPQTAREAAEVLAAAVDATVVHVMGRTFVLYRPAKEPQLRLPRA
ncbi:MAG: ribosome assembly RNA-binding protein YhbY [Clostridia bacterium]|nr:MAG: ribosome assembly RNA-binding protein YhbY [Clostridia bacterium]